MTVKRRHGFIICWWLRPIRGQRIGDALRKRLMRLFENHLYVKAIPSDLKTAPFYDRYGFRQYDHYSGMVRKHFL